MMQGWKSQNPPTRDLREPAVVLEARTSRSSGGHWMDAMLGAGSRKAVEQAFIRARAAGPAADRPLRVRTVGTEEEGMPLPRKRKGVIRLVLALGVLGWVLAQSPWEGLALPGIVQTVKKAGPEAKPAPAPAKVADAGGKALALWQSGTGQWHFVNKEGGLSRARLEDAQARLDLPRVSGPAVAGEEKRGKVVLRLRVPQGMLAELLPLDEELATEVESLSVSEAGARLRTHGGATVELGLGNYRAKQARLAAVLSDLAARKRAAALVDMRFEGSAVVKLASRF